MTDYHNYGRCSKRFDGNWTENKGAYKSSSSLDKYYPLHSSSPSHSFNTNHSFKPKINMKFLLLILLPMVLASSALRSRAVTTKECTTGRPFCCETGNVGEKDSDECTSGMQSLTHSFTSRGSNFANLKPLLRLQHK